MRVRCRAWGAGVVFAVAASHSAYGQTRNVHVIVRSAVSGLTIAGVQVELRHPSRDDTYWHSQTDTLGNATLSGVSSGPYRLSARRIGYEPTSYVVSIMGEDTLRVQLEPVAVALAPVTSSASVRRKLALAGFYERRKTGYGHFIDAARIAHDRPLRLVEYLRPWLKGCTMIWVEGLRMSRLGDIAPDQVSGIEIYASNASAPARFNNPIEGMKRCGSIVIWLE